MNIKSLVREYFKGAYRIDINIHSDKIQYFKGNYRIDINIYTLQQFSRRVMKPHHVIIGLLA